MSDATGYDVIVLGTGAAGLTAAITAHEQGARVGVFEKGDLVGGAAAWSVGQIWIPANRQMLKLGQQDSAADAVTYMAPIEGLYAVGNVMASPMGMTYGGGGTLRPGMVFGYRAGLHAGRAVTTKTKQTEDA